MMLDTPRATFSATTSSMTSLMWSARNDRTSASARATFPRTLNRGASFFSFFARPVAILPRSLPLFVASGTGPNPSMNASPSAERELMSADGSNVLTNPLTNSVAPLNAPSTTDFIPLIAPTMFDCPMACIMFARPLVKALERLLSCVCTPPVALSACSANDLNPSPPCWSSFVISSIRSDMVTLPDFSAS